MATNNIREEEVKNRIRTDFFSNYDATQVLGDIDFAVTTPCKDGEPELYDREYFFWAEAKAGTAADIYASFVQLILTIGKARTHEKCIPPRFLGAFDEEKIAFLEFHNIVSVFYQNDFNWKVTPSNHDTNEFKQLYGLLHDKLEQEIVLFYLRKDEKQLRTFIQTNFRMGKESTTGISITKNNFMFVFQRWVEEVKPSIEIDWKEIPPTRVVDFFYADLISRNDYTLRKELAVVLRGDRYKVLEQLTKSGRALFSEADFCDGMVAYRQFWNKYSRPPRREYLDIILMRRDLLIPQDLRKYKGAFFTPPQWVQKSQEYLAAELGDDWQSRYYVWDCCAGTGNLLFGLTEPYRVFASTLDNADVQVMHERVKEHSLDLLDSHIFQFDFLNDSFEKLPQSLQDIIRDPEKRQHLVVYINPPYAEASDVKTLHGGKAKNAVEQSVTNKKYAKDLRQGNAELFVQFFARIYAEIPSCVLAEFSKLKILQGPHFSDFRNFFRARLGRLFCVPANTFDNVTGEFPIGFMIWHTGQKEEFRETVADIYNAKGELLQRKTICAYDNSHFMNEWIKPYRGKGSDKLIIGKFPFLGNDFQHQKYVQIVQLNHVYCKESGQFLITPGNLAIACVYFAVRKSVEATWLNDRDQFLTPNDGWRDDDEFQSDCLSYTLFKNNIQSQYGSNHWIPFSEAEVGAQDVFQSHFMHDYIMGRLPKEEKKAAEQQLSFSFSDISLESGKVKREKKSGKPRPIVFSKEAQAVMDAGRELWRYYHKQPKANPNASYYDIRLHFQGTKTTPKGKVQMNTDSTDAHYMQLVTTLRQAVKALAKKIEPKVYEYGFLRV